MALANQAAAATGDKDLRGEHLLLGVIDDAGGVAIAALTNLDVKPAVLRAELIRRLAPAGSAVSNGRVQMGSKARVCIERALEEALAAGNAHVGTEHLLIALARDDGLLRDVFTQLGLTPEKIRSEVCTLTATGLEAPDPEAIREPNVAKVTLERDLLPAGTCPLCDCLRGESDDSRLVMIADLGLSKVFLNDNQGCPGWCVLTLSSHIEHLDVLPISTQAAVFAEVAAVAHAIRRVFPNSGAGGGPPRINYECLGNQVPHIHWHVIPRHADDPDPRNAVWGWPAERLRGSMTDAQRADLLARLRAALRRS